MAYTKPIHAAVLTFSCFAEGHVGMKIEKNQIAKDGKNRALTYYDLVALYEKYSLEWYGPRFFTLRKEKDSKEPTACVVVIRDGMRMLGVDKDKLLKQIQEIPGVDKQMLNTRQNKVQTKWKRHNFNIGDKSISADIANGQSTLYDFNSTFLTEAKKLRDAFTKMGKENKLETMTDLLAEANVYYADEYKKNNYCGIGYHGDAERPNSPVIGCNVGAERYLSFRSFYKSRYYGDEKRIKLNHGDIYFMSEHAVGVNWKKSAQVVYRHRAGSLKFLEKDDKDRQRRWELAEKKANAKKSNASDELEKKRKKDEVEVADYTEEVVRGGKKYRKVVTYVPMVDLT
jgi:alkylated DNA repair dioxygenase AlkB